MFGPSPSRPGRAPARCTTSTPRASRPSRRRPGRPAALGRAVGPTTTAAAAWSWVEKMLQRAQRTSAPSATSVSISTAVWIVMCSEPDDARALERLRAAYSCAGRHQAGHLVLGEPDLLAAELGEREVGDLEVGVGQRGGRWSCGSPLRRWMAQRRRGAAGASPAPSAASRRRDVLGAARARPRTSRRRASRSSASRRRRSAKPTSERPTSKLVEQLAQGAQALQLGRRRTGGSRRPSGGTRRARCARCSAACGATSRWSPPPRGWSGVSAMRRQPYHVVSRFARLASAERRPSGARLRAPPATGRRPRRTARYSETRSPSSTSETSRSSGLAAGRDRVRRRRAAARSAPRVSSMRSATRGCRSQSSRNTARERPRLARALPSRRSRCGRARAARARRRGPWRSR